MLFAKYSPNLLIVVAVKKELNKRKLLRSVCTGSVFRMMRHMRRSVDYRCLPLYSFRYVDVHN